jgi:hypothetical protein
VSAFCNREVTVPRLVSSIQPDTVIHHAAGRLVRGHLRVAGALVRSPVFRGGRGEGGIGPSTGTVVDRKVSYQLVCRAIASALRCYPKAPIPDTGCVSSNPSLLLGLGSDNATTVPGHSRWWS